MNASIQPPTTQPTKPNRRLKKRSSAKPPKPDRRSPGNLPTTRVRPSPGAESFAPQEEAEFEQLWQAHFKWAVAQCRLLEDPELSASKALNKAMLLYRASSRPFRPFLWWVLRWERLQGGRRQGRKKGRVVPLADGHHDVVDECIPQAIYRRELKEEIELAMHDFTTTDRELLWLLYEAQFTYEEIRDAL